MREDMEMFLKDGPITVNLKGQSTIPPPLLAYPKQLGCETAAYVPILQEGQLRGIVLIGAREGQKLDEDVINAFSRTIRLTANSITPKASPTEPVNDRRSTELQALNALASNAASVNDLHSFYSNIYGHVRNVIGDHGFVIALYEQKTNSISIPYLYEDGKLSTIESFITTFSLIVILLISLSLVVLQENKINISKKKTTLIVLYI